MSTNKLKTIKAFNSDMVLVDTLTENARLIHGEYYIVGESCFKMDNGRYYRINSGKIYYNHTTKVWQRNRDGLLYGILNSNEHGIPVVGYFEPTENTVGVSYKSPSDSLNPYLRLEPRIAVREVGAIGLEKGEKQPEKNKFKLKVETSNIFLEESSHNPKYCISRQLAEEVGFIESISDGTYYYKDNLTKDDFKVISRKGKAKYNIQGLPYNIADNNEFGNNIKEAYSESSHESNKLDEDLFKIIGDKSFGLEIETSLGHIPKHLLKHTGLVPLRDGSIRGLEYTTVPLEGLKGISTLRSIFQEVNKRCETDEQCSLHIHFGKFPCTKKSVTSLYTLCYRLQNELFEIVPPYKRDLRYFANKRGNEGRLKDHCKPLPGLALNTQNIFKEGVDTNSEINNEFGKIFQFLAEGTKEDKNFNFESRRHPREGTAKWNWESRYYHVNLIPLLFSNSRTVEFRLHQSTIHYSVMMHWLLICSSILNYAEKYQDKILRSREKITLMDVLSPIKEVNPKIFETLSNYIYYRRTEFNNDRYNDIYAEINRDARTSGIPKQFKYENI